MRPPKPVVERGMALARATGDPAVERACKRSVTQLRATHVVSAVTRAVDDVCFRGYRDVEIREPLFIAAPARSGTTLLFNLLARDPAFTCMKTYQSQLPAVSAERLVRLAARLDKPLGGRIRKLADKADAVTGRYEHIHRTKLNEPEEDSGLFLSALVEPNVNMVFPFGHELDDRWYLDDFDEPERTRIMDWYVGNLRRHLYTAPGRRLLVKNAHAAGRLASFRAAMPDLRVVNILRHPYQSVPSSVSLVANGYRALTGIEADVTAPEWRAVADATIEYYKRLHRFEAEFPADQWITVRFDDLVAEPMGTVERIYAHLGIPLSDDAAAAIGAEAATSTRHRSTGHGYSLEQFGLTPADVHEPLREVFEAYGLDR